ncbi:MAG: Crp/Fnr family transcriptional regulator [Flavobacterium sp.]
MQIDLDILFAWGAIAKEYKKNDIIFSKDNQALFYYQIIEGSVRIYNSNDEGKEFTQGVFCKGNSFGEPPLFINEVYITNAIALCDSIIVKLSKEKLMKIIEDYPSVKFSFLELMARRIYNKTVSINQIINHKPEQRIKFFLDSYKKQNELCREKKILIPYTRQEIANFTGLRVETVIRTLSEMNKSNIVLIDNHKLFF